VKIRTIRVSIKTNIMSNFTHLDASGNPTMVNVGDKAVTKRTARAQAIVILPDIVLEQLQNKEIYTKKGGVFQTAIIAGIMGAKKTPDLIPLCHPIGLENCKIEIHVNESKQVIIQCTASVTSKTGVEMEAITGATIAALTIYDMCKAFSQNIIIQEIALIEKTGGKSDYRKE
jgi:cyclic pyranopterin monophosphate synthase